MIGSFLEIVEFGREQRELEMLFNTPSTIQYLEEFGFPHQPM